MGALGVGIPDIPVFTGVILKSIYEVAMSYGFEYESDFEDWEVLYSKNYRSFYARIR